MRGGTVLGEPRVFSSARLVVCPGARSARVPRGILRVRPLPGVSSPNVGVVECVVRTPPRSPTAPSPARDPYAPASDAAAPREGYAAEGASTFSPNLPPGDAMVPTATIQPKMPTRSTPELSAVASSLAPPPTSCSRTRPIAIDGFEPPSDLAGPARPHERPRFYTERVAVRV